MQLLNGLKEKEMKTLKASSVQMRFNTSELGRSKRKSDVFHVKEYMQKGKIVLESVNL